MNSHCRHLFMTESAQPKQLPSRQTDFHIKRLSATQPSQTIKRHKIHRSQEAQQARLLSLSQTQTISLAKRLKNIINGKCKRSHTATLLSPAQPFPSEDSATREHESKRVKLEKRMDYGKKLLSFCRKRHSAQQKIGAAESKDFEENKVKNRVQRDYDFQAMNKSQRKEGLLIDFNKNQQSMFSISRKQVLPVESDQAKVSKCKEPLQGKDGGSFQDVFYKSYLAKFKERKKLLRGKHKLMKMVSS